MSAALVLKKRSQLMLLMILKRFKRVSLTSALVYKIETAATSCFLDSSSHEVGTVYDLLLSSIIVIKMLNA